MIPNRIVCEHGKYLKKDSNTCSLVSGRGFEPLQLALPELESGPLDRSGILTKRQEVSVARNNTLKITVCISVKSVGKAVSEEVIFRLGGFRVPSALPYFNTNASAETWSSSYHQAST